MDWIWSAPSSIQKKNGWRSRTRAHSDIPPNCKPGFRPFDPSVPRMICITLQMINSTTFKVKVKSNGGLSYSHAWYFCGIRLHRITEIRSYCMTKNSSWMLARIWVPETKCTSRFLESNPIRLVRIMLTHLHHLHFLIIWNFRYGLILFYDFESGAKSICILIVQPCFRDPASRSIYTSFSPPSKHRIFQSTPGRCFRWRTSFFGTLCPIFLLRPMAGVEVLQMQSISTRCRSTGFPNHLPRDHYLAEKLFQQLPSMHRMMRAGMMCLNPAPLKNWMEFMECMFRSQWIWGSYNTVDTDWGVKSVPHEVSNGTENSGKIRVGV